MYARATARGQRASLAATPQIAADSGAFLLLLALLLLQAVDLTVAVLR